MSIFYIPVVEISLSILGFGFTIMFCTAFCKACHRFREEREEWRRSQEAAAPPPPPPIYFIQYPGSMSRQDGDDFPRSPFGPDVHGPPRYSTSVHCGPPPSYNECISSGTHPESTNVPVHPIIPPQYTETAQTQSSA